MFGGFGGFDTPPLTPSLLFFETVLLGFGWFGGFRGFGGFVTPYFSFFEILLLGFGWFGEFRGFEGFDTPFILLILLSSLKCFDDLISHKIKLLIYVIVLWDHF